MNFPDSTVIWLRDSEGLFPYAALSGDNDALTDGWAFFTSTSRQEVVLVQLERSEHRAGPNEINSALGRLSRVLGRTDLRHVSLVRLERASKAKGTSFQSFLKSRPTPIYSALSGTGEAVIVREESIEQFQSNGGIFTRVNA